MLLPKMTSCGRCHVWLVGICRIEGCKELRSDGPDHRAREDPKRLHFTALAAASSAPKPCCKGAVIVIDRCHMHTPDEATRRHTSRSMDGSKMLSFRCRTIEFGWACAALHLSESPSRELSKHPANRIRGPPCVAACITAGDAGGGK